MSGTAQRVANLSDVAFEVTIQNDAGHTTSVFVQGKGRPRLPEGYRVTPQCMQDYAGRLVILTPAISPANALKALATPKLKEGV